MIAIPGLSDADQATLTALLNRLDATTPRNALRVAYYESKYAYKDLMVSVPPRIRDRIDTVLDWPAKAVDLLSQRLQLESFVIPGASDTGVMDLWVDNAMDLESMQAHDSALVQCCAFVWTTLGDVSAGEPRVVINTVSALNGTAIRDPRTRRLSSALQIVERSVDGGEPVVMVMALPDRVLTMVRQPGGRWDVDDRPHSLGRVPVEVIPFLPSLERPFGRSRISRPIMSLTDSGLRTIVRSEVGAEFFAAPRIAAMNMPQGAFDGSVWDAVMSRALVIDAPAADDMDADPAWQPSIQQLSQVSMQPHVEQFRMFASNFAAAAFIPLDAVGIVSDNPSSAEAIEKNEKNLSRLAKKAGLGFALAWVQVMRNAYALANNTTDLSALAGMQAVMTDPRLPSPAAASDAILKQSSTPGLEWIGQTEVALEKLGYDRQTIDRLIAEKRRINGTGALASILARGENAAADGGGVERRRRERPESEG